MSIETPVPADYVAHIDIERIVFGADLQDGMVVLIEASRMRSGVFDSDAGADQWCIVSQLRIKPRPEQGSALVTFVGIYADGTARVRSYDESYGWIVKRKAAA